LGENKVFPDREPRFSLKLKNPTSAIFFLKLVVEKKAFEQTRQEVVELFGVEEERNQEILEDIRSFHRQFEYAEYLPRNPPAYH